MTTTAASLAGRAQRVEVNGHRPDSGPVPPVRRRNLTRTAIGVVVVAVSILGVVSLTATTGRTRAVLVAVHTVPAGEAITAADLRAIRVPSTLAVPTVAAADRARIVGRRSLATLTAGALLTDGQFGSSGATAGTAVIGATLKPGQYPTQLAVGDRVLLVIAPNPSGTDTPGDQAPVRGVVTDLGSDATGTQSNGMMVVSLRVRATDAPTVAAAGGSGSLDLVVVAP